MSLSKFDFAAGPNGKGSNWRKTARVETPRSNAEVVKAALAAAAAEKPDPGAFYDMQAAKKRLGIKAGTTQDGVFDDLWLRLAEAYQEQVVDKGLHVESDAKSAMVSSLSYMMKGDVATGMHGGAAYGVFSSASMQLDGPSLEKMKRTIDRQVSKPATFKKRAQPMGYQALGKMFVQELLADTLTQGGLQKFEAELSQYLRGVAGASGEGQGVIMASPALEPQNSTLIHFSRRMNARRVYEYAFKQSDALVPLLKRENLLFSDCNFARDEPEKPAIRTR